MIRVLHIHTLPVISGSGINTFLTMKGIHGDIFHMELACAPGGPLLDLVRAQGIKVIPFDKLVQPLNPVKDALIAFELARFLHKERYHIVHTHNSKAGFVGRLSARLARVPVIIHTVHGFAFHDQEPPWRRFLFRNLERTASRWCDRMIFISQPLIDWALREKIVPRARTVKIYSGIDLNRFQPVPEDEKTRIRDRWGIQYDAPVIGIISKLWEGKGHAVLIKAFKEIKKEIKGSRLVIVGEGPLYEDLNALVAGLGLRDSVIFTGFRSDVAAILACLDIAVLPSLFEGMGRALLEAMAMEKPVVASNVGGIPDLVKDGMNGFLTSPGDAKALTHALMKLLHNRDLASRMGREGRRMVSQQFSEQTMVESIRQIYVEQLKRKEIPVGV